MLGSKLHAMLHSKGHYLRLMAAITLAWWLPMAVPSLSAQEKFTDHIQRETEGQGRISIEQDPEIERLVNGLSPRTAPSPSAPAPAPSNSPSNSPASPADSPSTVSASGGFSAGNPAAPADSTTAQRDSTQQQRDQRIFSRRARTNGYRIQLYAGGNNRKSKTEAYHVAGLVHTYFDDVPVYTHFLSPRWVCRVGDCRTMEEATELLERLRQTGKFPEATIVKTKIIIYLM